MSAQQQQRRYSWDMRREKRIAEAQEKVRNQRRVQGIRTVPPEARLNFLCGHDGCGRAFQHDGEHTGGGSR